MGLLFMGALALMLGLPTLYARQANAAGWVGLAGYALLTAGIVLILLYAGGSLADPYFTMRASVTAFALGLAAILRLLLTGIATVRAGVYPRWSGYLLLGAGAVFCLGFLAAETLPPWAAAITGSVLPLLLAASFVALGVALWRAEARPSARSA